MEVIILSVSAVFAASIYLIYYCLKREIKKVKLWLTDAVIVSARTKKTAETMSEGRSPSIKISAIQVRFSYLGKHYLKKSMKKEKPLCREVFNSYVNKRILIAYSPKYDKVMFIKPESEKRILEEFAENKIEVDF